MIGAHGDADSIRKYGYSVKKTAALDQDLEFERLRLANYYSLFGGTYYQTALAKLILGEADESRVRKNPYGPGSAVER